MLCTIPYINVFICFIFYININLYSGVRLDCGCIWGFVRDYGGRVFRTSNECEYFFTFLIKSLPYFGELMIFFPSGFDTTLGNNVLNRSNYYFG